MIRKITVTPALALLAAQWLEKMKGYKIGSNLLAEAFIIGTDRRLDSPVWTIVLYENEEVSLLWSSSTANLLEGVLGTFSEFVDWFNNSLSPKMFNIGCRTLQVLNDKTGVVLVEDGITIPRAQIEEILKELQ